MWTPDPATFITAEMKAAQAREAKVAEVIKERERRLALGFDYNFNDARGIHRIATTDEDMRGWDEVTKVANAMLALGDQTSSISIITGSAHAVVTAI